MSDREHIFDVFVDAISNILNKPKEEILSGLDAKFKDDFKMTSLQYFPLISKMEEMFDIELDYKAFLANVHTVNEGVNYMLAMINGK